MKVRIKTLEEFVREFGKDWRKVGASFPTDMDYLFGQIITLNEAQQKCLSNLKWFRMDKNYDGLSWQISSEMFYMVEELPSYLKPNANKNYILI